MQGSTAVSPHHDVAIPDLLPLLLCHFSLPPRLQAQLLQLDCLLSLDISTPVPPTPWPLALPSCMDA